MVKNLPANSGDSKDVGLIPGLGRFPGEGNGYPLQYSCLEYPMDRGVWWARVYGVAKCRTQLSTHTHIAFISIPSFRNPLKTNKTNLGHHLPAVIISC